MKKFCAGVFKFIFTLIALGAAIYAVITYWDKIMELLAKAKIKLSEAKCACCGSEYDDYADWDQ